MSTDPAEHPACPHNKLSADDSSESAETPEQRRVLALLMKKFE